MKVTFNFSLAFFLVFMSQFTYAEESVGADELIMAAAPVEDVAEGSEGVWASIKKLFESDEAVETAAPAEEASEEVIVAAVPVEEPELATAPAASVEGEDAELDGLTVDFLQDRNGVRYRPNQIKPFTGTYLARHTSGIEMWFDDGQIIEETFYKDGLRDGPSRTWYIKALDAWGLATGQKKEEGNWLMGKRIGVFSSWYEGGEKRDVSNWTEGKRNGPATRWYPNGQIQSSTVYKDGAPDGLATIWNVNGRETIRALYRDGVLVERNGEPVKKPVQEPKS